MPSHIYKLFISQTVYQLYLLAKISERLTPNDTAKPWALAVSCRRGERHENLSDTPAPPTGISSGRWTLPGLVDVGGSSAHIRPNAASMWREFEHSISGKIWRSISQMGNRKARNVKLREVPWNPRNENRPCFQRLQPPRRMLYFD